MAQMTSSMRVPAGTTGFAPMAPNPCMKSATPRGMMRVKRLKPPTQQMQLKMLPRKFSFPRNSPHSKSRIPVTMATQAPTDRRLVPGSRERIMLMLVTPPLMIP